MTDILKRFGMNPRNKRRYRKHKLISNTRGRTWKFSPRHAWKDYDKDGVVNRYDCRPLNQYKQDNPKPEDGEWEHTGKAYPDMLTKEGRDRLDESYKEAGIITPRIIRKELAEAQYDKYKEPSTTNPRTGENKWDASLTKNADWTHKRLRGGFGEPANTEDEETILKRPQETIWSKTANKGRGAWEAGIDSLPPKEEYEDPRWDKLPEWNKDKYDKAIGKRKSTRRKDLELIEELEQGYKTPEYTKMKGKKSRYHIAGQAMKNWR